MTRRGDFLLFVYEILDPLGQGRLCHIHGVAQRLPFTDATGKIGIGNSAYALVRSGRIHSIKIGRQIRIPKSSLVEFLETAQI